MATLILSFLSGIPALVYQVAWTREVGLFAGSQVEAISAVLVSFFGGLALGARTLGGFVDHVRRPLRFYGVLEIAAGLAAAATLFALRALSEIPRAADTGLLAPTMAILLPVTFLLGGTQPALLRAAVTEPGDTARRAGWIVAANTAGAVAGVALAVASIPSAGLRATLLWAAAGSAAVGAAALVLSRRIGAHRAAGSEVAAPRPASGILLAAGVAGLATLAYEVLVARMAALHLGSSLYAWGLVLALFLLALATGNALGARRAAATSRPAADLGWIEAASAVCIGLGLLALAPSLTSPARGLTDATALAVAAGALPAVLMGGAFPFFVRLGVPGARIGAGFGAVSAINTAGGIAGALLAPFVLLPALGPTRGALFCAALAAVLAAGFLVRAGGSLLRPVFAVGLAAVAAAPSLAARPPKGPGHAIFVDYGRQATAAVVRVGNRRELIVDGDVEASTGGDARRTEELLAALPLVMHPDPHRFLEAGLGSGITLATATRFPLEQIDCVEIADSVLRARPYFEPDNRTGAAASPRIVRGDARVFLTRHPSTYDVIVANTLHPWSVGATGLYSREYFGRMAASLRSGGLAVQWLPVERIGRRSLSAIVRTFFAVFPHGGLWWGPGNLLIVGSDAPLPALDPARIDRRLREAGLSFARLDLADARELSLRFIADARVARDVLGPGDVLVDDRPSLEVWATRGRAGPDDSPRTVPAEMARVALGRDADREPILFWLESLEARARGDDRRADARSSLAEAGGLDLARRHRARRWVERGNAQLDAGAQGAGDASFREALAIDPAQRDARFALAALAARDGRPEAARDEIERLLAQHPDDAEAWNLLATVRSARHDEAGARHALDRALALDPFFPEALANAGLLAIRAGDPAGAERMLARLRAASPLNSTPGENALAAGLGN